MKFREGDIVSYNPSQQSTASWKPFKGEIGKVIAIKYTGDLIVRFKKVTPMGIFTVTLPASRLILLSTPEKGHKLTRIFK